MYGPLVRLNVLESAEPTSPEGVLHEHEQDDVGRACGGSRGGSAPGGRCGGGGAGQPARCRGSARAARQQHERQLRKQHAGPGRERHGRLPGGWCRHGGLPRQ
ncbi:hypothetical protein SNL152K_1778 [Streptomyces sp. NL15-2K]|nr:hypothetical protein SNL152K_1778 [Streptomyces sp. NL15-2K]